MIIVPLLSIPNQLLEINLEMNAYKIQINAIDDNPSDNNLVMTISIIRNDIEIISGTRAITGSLVIPYLYLEDGNFAFFTSNGEYPNYTKFGIDQNLSYITKEELEQFRG